MHRFACGLLLAGIVAGFGTLAWQAPLMAAQDAKSEQDKQSEQDRQKELMQQVLRQLSIPQPIPVLPRDGEYAPSQMFDLDGDGSVDLTVEWTTGRGPLSTYYSTYRIVAHGDVRILKGGAPQDPGAEISLLDLIAGTKEATLCTVGASLRYPERPASDFSGGPWWGKTNRALAVAIVKEGEVQLGYINLTVTQQAKITFEGKNLVTLSPAKVIVDGAIE